MASIPEAELDEIYRFAIQLGREAGQMLLDGLQRRRATGGEAEAQVEKLNAVDIVTQTDHGTPPPSLFFCSPSRFVVPSPHLLSHNPMPSGAE